MKRIRSFQATWVVVLAILTLGLVATPASANNRTSGQDAQRSLVTSINANIYITTGTLQPLFQSRINQQVPGAFNSAMNGVVDRLPAQDQKWARQLAAALIQPAVSLTGLAPRQNGLLTSLLVSLYPGDPRPISVQALVSFRVVNASTVQVSVQSLNGGPALVTGSIAGFQIPIGQVNRVAATPACGDAALTVNLRFPVALAMGQAVPQVSMADIQQPAGPAQRNAGGVQAYVEIPASSLAALGGSIGSMPINSSLSARNIRVGVQGSNLLITSDIYLGSFQLGVATTTLAPTAAGGNLAVHVLSTNLTLFQIFTFPYNSYNQQIEQTLNKKLNGALAGKFYVTQAAIGTNRHVPCVANNSLLLTGTTSLG